MHDADVKKINRVICYTEVIPEHERISDKHIYRRGWAHFGGADPEPDSDDMPIMGDMSVACRMDEVTATKYARKLLAQDKINIYTYTDDTLDDLEEPRVVKYYTGEEYDKLMGSGPSSEEVYKLTEAARKFANQPRRDHKALASHILNLLFPDGVNIKDAEWRGYNALFGMVNGLCSYCIDLQRGGAGGILTLVDIMKDTQTLLQMEGYSVGNTNEEESGNNHGKDPEHTE